MVETMLNYQIFQWHIFMCILEERFWKQVLLLTSHDEHSNLTETLDLSALNQFPVAYWRWFKLFKLCLGIICRGCSVSIVQSLVKMCYVFYILEYLSEIINFEFFQNFYSSFDEYSSELKSGRLEWSPVHKSEKFWRENAARLNEKNYELLK